MSKLNVKHIKNTKPKNDLLYVRGVSISNIEFIRTEAARLGYTNAGEYINMIFNQLKEPKEDAS